MTAKSETPIARRSRGGWRRMAVAAGIVVLVAAMALDTEVVVIGSEEDVQEDVFNPAAFGAERFPEIRDLVIERAVDAQTLSAAIAEDQAAAGQEYGTPAGIGPVMPVSFTGTAGEERAGVYDVEVEGLAGDVQIRVQTGPAINGTDLRDFPGDIAFGDFRNQIEYQDAGSAINNAMKEEVLAPVDTDNLTGRTISVTGVFKLINPNNWLVTPVELSVE